MDNLLFKSGNNGQVNVDQALGIVECFVAGIGNKDSVGDVVISGAFAKSLTHRKPRVVWGHSWNDPIGKVLEMYEVPIGDSRLPSKMRNAGIGGLYAKVQFNLQSEKGKEAFATVAFFGEDQEWSIGYKTIDSIFDPNLQANILKEVELYEVSPVLHGANQLTGTISIKTDEKSHMPIIPMQGDVMNVMPGMNEMPRIVVISAPNNDNEDTTNNPFAEGMSRELSQPDKNKLQAELVERTGSGIEVFNATENIVIFRRTTSDGKASMYRLPYHNEGGQFMFGKPEPYAGDTPKPQPMQNIEQKPTTPVVVPNGGIAYRNDDQQEMMNMFGGSVESPFGKSEISHLIELPEAYMTSAKDYLNPVLRHHKLIGRPSSKGIIVDGVLTAKALDALQNAVKALGATLGQTSGNIGQAIGKIRDLAQTFNPFALDGDGDGEVQDGSAFARPYIPIKKPGFDLPDVRGRKRSGDKLLDKPRATPSLPKDRNKWTPVQRGEALLGGLIEPETREDIALLSNKRPENEGIAKYWDMSEADLTKEGNKLVNARRQSSGAEKERIDEELLKVSHDFSRRASYAETFGQEFVPPAKREMPKPDLVPVDITQNESIARMLGAPKSKIPRTDEGFASRSKLYEDMFDRIIKSSEGLGPNPDWAELSDDEQGDFAYELRYDYMYNVEGFGDDGVVDALDSGRYDNEIAEFAGEVWNNLSKQKSDALDKERRSVEREAADEEERTERFRPTMAELAMEAEADDEIDNALERYVGEQPFGNEESGFASRGLTSEPPLNPPEQEVPDEFEEDFVRSQIADGELSLEALQKYNSKPEYYNRNRKPLSDSELQDLYDRYQSFDDQKVMDEAVDEIYDRFFREISEDNYDQMVEAYNYVPDYGDDGFASRGEPFGFASRDNDGDVKQNKLDEMIEGVRTRLLEELETADPSTWKPSWRNDSLPINATTGKPYRGWNSFWLMLRTSGADYQTGRYATYNQLIARGAQVRKGEKGVSILRPQLMKSTDKDGNDKEWIKFFGATVFNVDQADGGDEALRAIVADLPEEQRIKILEATIAELGVSVKTDNMSGPHYSPTGDYVSMPDFSKGTGALEWNSSLAHETIHWTGGASRLNRPSITNYSDSKQIRAYEELIAEVGSAMFLAAHGIDAPFREDHAPYIKGWISLLKDDPDALARAFKDATAAMNYVLEKSPNLRNLFGGTDSGKKAPEVDAPDLVGAAVNSSEGFASLHRIRTPRSEAIGGILYDDSSRELMVGFLKGSSWDKASPEDRQKFIDRSEIGLSDGNRFPSTAKIMDDAEASFNDARDIGWYVYDDVDMTEVEELAIVRSKGRHINALKKIKKARKATDEDQFNFFGRDERMQDVVSSKMNDGFASRGPKEPQEGLRRHKLMTAEIRGKIPQLDTTEDVPTNEKVLAVKFFSPYSDWTWYGVEFDGEDMFFGYVEGFEKEWGYFSLNELAKTQLGGMVPAVERDTSFRPTKFGDLNKADGFASRGSKRLGVEPKHTDPTWVDKTQRRILRQDTDWGSLSYDDQIDWANSFLQEFIEENEMGHDLTDLVNGRRLNTRPDIGLMNYAESAYARMSDSHSRRRAQFGERPDGESDGFASVGSRTRRLGMQPSEAVDYVSYDPDSENLFVAYKREDGRGDMYVYEGVSMDDAVALENAPSAGRAINDIKRRKNVRKATSVEVVGLSKPLTGNKSQRDEIMNAINDVYANPGHGASRDVTLEINADRISVDDNSVTWESNDNTTRYTMSVSDTGKYVVSVETLSKGGREEPDTFETTMTVYTDNRSDAIGTLLEAARNKIANDDEDSRLDRELADVTRELDMAGDAPGVESIDVTYSTALDAVDYNPATKEMRISYKDGGTYIYEGVDADEVDAFKSAPSKGRATNDIKRAHSFRKDSEWSGGGDEDFDIEEFDVSGSKAVEQVSYDPEKEDLMVVYAGGKGYVYSGVTREEADAFRSAPSKGRAINDVKRTHEVRMLTGEDVRFFGSKKAGEFTPSEIRDDEEYSKDELRSFIEEQEGLLEVMDLNGESAEKLAQQRTIIDNAKRDLLASDPAPVAAPKMPTNKPPRGGKRVRNRSVAIEMEQGTLDEIIDAEKQGITVDELRAAAGGRGGKYTKGPRKGKYRGADTITVRDSETGELLHSNEILLTSSASPGSPSSANRKRGYIRARSYVGRQGHTTTKDEGPSLRGDGKGMTDYDKRVYGLGSDEKNRDAGLASRGMGGPPIDPPDYPEVDDDYYELEFEIWVQNASLEDFLDVNSELQDSTGRTTREQPFTEEELTKLYNAGEFNFLGNKLRNSIIDSHGDDFEESALDNQANSYDGFASRGGSNSAKNPDGDTFGSFKKVIERESGYKFDDLDDDYQEELYNAFLDGTADPVNIANDIAAGMDDAAFNSRSATYESSFGRGGDADGFASMSSELQSIESSVKRNIVNPGSRYGKRNEPIDKDVVKDLSNPFNEDGTLVYRANDNEGDYIRVSYNPDTQKYLVERTEADRNIDRDSPPDEAIVDSFEADTEFEAGSLVFEMAKDRLDNQAEGDSDRFFSEGFASSGGRRSIDEMENEFREIADSYDIEDPSAIIDARTDLIKARNKAAREIMRENGIDPSTVRIEMDVVGPFVPGGDEVNKANDRDYELLNSYEDAIDKTNDLLERFRGQKNRAEAEQNAAATAWSATQELNKSVNNDSKYYDGKELLEEAFDAIDAFLDDETSVDIDGTEDDEVTVLHKNFMQNKREYKALRERMDSLGSDDKENEESAKEIYSSLLDILNNINNAAEDNYREKEAEYDYETPFVDDEADLMDERFTRSTAMLPFDDGDGFASRMDDKFSRELLDNDKNSDGASLDDLAKQYGENFVVEFDELPEGGFRESVISSFIDSNAGRDMWPYSKSSSEMTDKEYADARALVLRGPRDNSPSMLDEYWGENADQFFGDYNTEVDNKFDADVTAYEANLERDGFASRASINESSTGQRIVPSRMHSDDRESLAEVTDPEERKKQIDSLIEFYGSRIFAKPSSPKRKKIVQTQDENGFWVGPDGKPADLDDGFASMYPKDEVGLEQFINQQEMELEDYAVMSKLEPMKYPPSGLESTKKRIATAKRDLARIQKNKPKQVEEEEFLESIDGFASRGTPNLNNMGFGPMDDEYWTTSDRSGRKTWDGTDAERGTTWTIQTTDQGQYEVSGSFDDGFGDEEVIDFGTEESYDDLEGAKRFVESFEVDDDDFQPSDSDIFTEQDMMDDFRDSGDGFASRDSELAEGMVASEIESNYARLNDEDQNKYFQRALANNADSGLSSEAILEEAKKLAMDDREMARLERQAVGMGGSSEPRKIDVSSSSALNYVAYDATNRSLDVEYRGRDGKGTGTLYSYKDVDPEIVDSIENSDSRGATIRQVRDNYEFTTSQRLPDSAYEGLASSGGLRYSFLDFSPQDSQKINMRVRDTPEFQDLMEIQEILDGYVAKDIPRSSMPDLDKREIAANRALVDRRNYIVDQMIDRGEITPKSGILKAEEKNSDELFGDDPRAMSDGFASRPSRQDDPIAYFKYLVDSGAFDPDTDDAFDYVRDEGLPMSLLSYGEGRGGSGSKRKFPESTATYGGSGLDNDQEKEITETLEGSTDPFIQKLLRQTKLRKRLSDKQWAILKDRADREKKKTAPKKPSGYVSNVRNGGTIAPGAAPSGIVTPTREQIADTAGLEKIISDAKYNGRALRFNYNGKDREVIPVQTYTNPKTGKVNMVGQDVSGERKTFTIDKMSPSTEMASSTADGFASRGSKRPKSRWSPADRQRFADGNILRSRKQQGKRRQGPSANEFDGFASLSAVQSGQQLANTPYDSEVFEGGVHGPGKDISLSKMWENYKKRVRSQVDGGKVREADGILAMNSVDDAAKFFNVSKELASKILQARDPRAPELFTDDVFLATHISEQLGYTADGVSSKLIGFNPMAYYDDEGNEIDDFNYWSGPKSAPSRSIPDEDKAVEDAIRRERARMGARAAAREGRRVGKTSLTKGAVTVRDLEDALKKVDPNIKLTDDDGAPLSAGAMSRAIQRAGVALPWSSETYRRINRDGGVLSPRMIDTLIGNGLLNQSFAPARNDLAVSEALQWPGFKDISAPKMINALSETLGLDRAEIAKMQRTIEENLSYARQGRREKRRISNIQKQSLKLTKEKIAKLMETLGLSVADFDEWFTSAPFDNK